MAERPYNPESKEDRAALAKTLEAMLATARFVKTPSTSRGSEDVYEFVIDKIPGARIMVFTSIVHGAVRAEGKDAIRVAMIYTRKRDGQNRTLVDDARVNRTGTIEGIAERTLGRMRSVFKGLQDRMKNGLVCRHCGAPLMTTKKGKDVCAEACWDKGEKPSQGPSSGRYGAATDGLVGPSFKRLLQENLAKDTERGDADSFGNDTGW